MGGIWIEIKTGTCAVELTRRYLWGALVAALIPLAIIAGLYDRYGANLLNNLIENRVETNLEATAAKMSNFMAVQVNRLENIAATVAIADINMSAAKETAAELGDAAYAVEIDVCDQISIDKAMSAVVSKAGKLDILINNATLFDAAETIDISRESYDKLYAVNVSGTLFTLQAAAKQMIAQGHGGKIINMASQAGRRGESLVLVYCSTKAAVISMTQSAGLNLIKHGINVNAIAPGVVDGEHWEHVDAMFAKLENKEPGQKKAEVANGVPAGRFATPDDLTGMAIFLASSESDYIVAQTYNVDGGQWMS